MHRPNQRRQHSQCGAARCGQQHIHTIFDVLGLSFDSFTPVHMGFAEGADALIAGKIDAQFQPPIPNRVMMDLSQRVDVGVVLYAPG